MPFAFVVAVAGLSITIWSAGAGSRAKVARLSVASLIAFGLLSLGLAFLGALAMNSCFARYVNSEVTRGDWLSIWALLFPPALPFVL